MLVCASALRPAPAPAATAGETVELQSELGVVVVSGVVMNELVEQQQALELADLPGRAEPWLAPASSAHLPRPSPIQEGPSDPSSSSTLFVRLAGHLLSS